DEIYTLLHPMMPFMTEELWRLTAGDGERDDVLALTRWPSLGFEDDEAAADLNWLVDLVSGIRSVRAEMNVPPAAQAPLIAVGADELTRERLARHDPAIRRLARVRELGFSSEVPKGSAQIVLAGTTFCLPLGELIDIKAEAARLEKELGKAGAEIERIEKKLSNEKFV